jgi:hypothetical protein
MPLRIPFRGLDPSGVGSGAQVTTSATINTVTTIAAQKLNRSILRIKNSHGAAAVVWVNFGADPVAATRTGWSLSQGQVLEFNSETVPTDDIRVVSSTASVLLEVINR